MTAKLDTLFLLFPLLVYVGTIYFHRDHAMSHKILEKRRDKNIYINDSLKFVEYSLIRCGFVTNSEKPL